MNKTDEEIKKEKKDIKNCFWVTIVVSLLYLLFLLSISSPSYADTILLKNGDLITGNIVDVDMVNMSYRIDVVENGKLIGATVLIGNSEIDEFLVSSTFTNFIRIVSEKEVERSRNEAIARKTLAMSDRFYAILKEKRIHQYERNIINTKHKNLKELIYIKDRSNKEIVEDSKDMETRSRSKFVPLDWKIDTNNTDNEDD